MRLYLWGRVKTDQGDVAVVAIARTTSEAQKKLDESWRDAAAIPTLATTADYSQDVYYKPNPEKSSISRVWVFPLAITCLVCGGVEMFEDLILFEWEKESWEICPACEHALEGLEGELKAVAIRAIEKRAALREREGEERDGK